MKKLLTGLVCALVLVAFVAVEANASERASTITVSGSGAVDVAPDIATVTFGVRTEEVTAQAAQAANTEIVNRVLGALAAAGVEEDDIATTNFSLNPVFRHTGRERQQTGYMVNTSLRVTVRNIDRVGYVLTAANNAGVTSTGHINFSIADSTAPYHEALALASQNARGRADAIASTLGVRIVGVQSVTEQWGRHTPVARGGDMVMEEAAWDVAMPMAAAAPAPIQVSDLSVEANLSVVFLIE